MFEKQTLNNNSRLDDSSWTPKEAMNTSQQVVTMMIQETLSIYIEIDGLQYFAGTEK
jgi:hypothetical protein